MLQAFPRTRPTQRGREYRYTCRCSYSSWLKRRLLRRASSEPEAACSCVINFVVSLRSVELVDRAIGRPHLISRVRRIAGMQRRIRSNSAFSFDPVNQRDHAEFLSAVLGGKLQPVDCFLASRLEVFRVTPF